MALKNIYFYNLVILIHHVGQSTMIIMMSLCFLLFHISVIIAILKVFFCVWLESFLHFMFSKAN